MSSATDYVPLLEDYYAPDTFKVLVTCIFLNKTPATRAKPHIERFFRNYDSPEDMRDTTANDLYPYFKTLGLGARAKSIVKLADQLRNDPPRQDRLRQKPSSEYSCEVAHLAGVGRYACDAWRIYCKDAFYGRNASSRNPEWKTVLPNDKDLVRCLKHRWLTEGYDWNPRTGIALRANTVDEKTSELADALSGMTLVEPQIIRAQRAALTTSGLEPLPKGVFLGPMFVPERIIKAAKPLKRLDFAC